ncbi:RsbT co-antagonist protein RsbRC [Bacillus sp. THAF10]|uniref:STAS domain-containing protein n=1 Tax=Bacillus sp. THAF10 TaxID=2587848 RepID=UPI00126907C1|nr:STAS domain-containing protein [Bacillus sp. THAF10]QFT89630.1 RsbT co-antagonist protein RsbRC [Bacillus sp. THAF10]
MEKNVALHDFIVNNTDALTAAWFQSKKAKEGSIYSSTIPTIGEKLRQQNKKFIITIAQIFINPDTDSIYDAIKQWASDVAKDRVSTNTELNEILPQFKVFRQIYWNKINEFASEPTNSITSEKLLTWSNRFHYAFDHVIEVFVATYTAYHKSTLLAHQEMISELSSPIIKLTNDIGVLPLIGSIDTQRAVVIMESSLKQCQQKNVECLVIDLSGVPIVDTMVANQLFTVVTALELIGVKSIMTGVRPEVAQTAIHLGLDFSHITIYSTLEKALEKWEFRKSTSV